MYYRIQQNSYYDQSKGSISSGIIQILNQNILNFTLVANTAYALIIYVINTPTSPVYYKITGNLEQEPEAEPNQNQNLSQS